MYVFLDKKKEGIFYFSGAVQKEKQAKKIAHDCLSKANLKIDYTEIIIKQEEEEKETNGLFLLLESRYSDGKFAPTGKVAQTKMAAENFLEAAPLGVPRKYVDIEIVKPHKALSLIFQNE